MHFPAKLLILLCLLTICQLSPLWSQTTITGYIADVQKQAVANINIVISPNGQNTIIAYGFSDDKGYFTITFFTTHDSIDVTVSSLAYERHTKTICNTSQEIRFTLIPDIKQLETFTVRASPIVRKGDTLSYLVQSFAGKTDRSIEDVLRRMPGIEVEQGGKILYNGLPIEKFYVEGLDLMDGRYAPISRNLPHEAVATVEVFENHQPIEILRDRLSSQQASLNLKLKRKTTYTGSAKIGAGYSDELLWNADISSMGFTSQFQALTSMQSNNTGLEIAQQFRMLGFQDAQLHPLHPGTSLVLLIPQPQLPLNDLSRFLFNQSHLLNLNGLLKLNKGMTLRVNNHFLHDNRKLNSTTKRSIVSPVDSSVFNETLNNHLFSQFLRTIITLNNNTRKNYLENKLQFEAWRRSANANISFQGTNSNQMLQQPQVSLTNNFRMVFPVALQLIELKSYFLYENQDESLNLTPGMFENIFNNGSPYETANQTVLTKRFYTHQTAGLITKWKNLSFFTSAGFVFKLQNLNSQLSTTSDVLNPPDSGYLNNNQVVIFRPYLKSGMEYKYKSLVVKAELPVSLHVQYADDTYHTELFDASKRLLFEPKGSLHYQFKGFWQSGATIALIQRQAETDELYYGYVLTHYNRLIRNHLPNALIKGHTFSLRLSYRNPISSLFQSITYANSYIKHPYLLSTMLYSDGRAEVFPVDISVLTANHSIHYSGSFYFSKARTSLSIKTIGGKTQRQNLLNEQAFDTRTAYLFISPQLNTQLISWMHAEYGFEQRWLLTKAEFGSKHLTANSKHLLNLFMYLSGNTNVVFANAYYNFGSRNAFFSDLRFSRKLKPKGMELEIAVNNIFNAKTYIEFHASTYMFFEYIYALRPMQVIATLKFSL